MSDGKFREPVRIHIQGLGRDIVITHVGSSCGDIEKEDGLSASFDDGRVNLCTLYPWNTSSTPP